MKQINAEYRITVNDYRKANYYALFLRHRTALRIMFVVIIVSVIYAIGAVMQLGQANPFVFLLSGAYMIWGIILFAGVEKTVLSYIKSPDNFIGCTYRAIFEKTRMRIRLPERNVDFCCSIHNLACVFELSSMFLVYSNTQEVFIVPKRDFTPEDVISLRTGFQDILKERFYTRFTRK